MLGTTDRSSRGPVYPRGRAAVNPVDYGMAAILALLVLHSGCALNRPQNAARVNDAFYPLGIRYGVESVLPADPEQRARRLDSDLATIRRMGLNIVWFRHLEPEMFPSVAAAARPHHLRIILPDRAAQYYVMTGRPDPESGPSAWLMDTRSGAVRETLWAMDLGWPADDVSTRRLERVAAAYRTAPSAPATLAQTEKGDAARLMPFRGPEKAGGASAENELRPLFRPLMILPCARLPGENPADAVRRWIGDFHAGLAQGLTGGLLLDQYCMVPGRETALADGDGGVGLERMNAVKRLATRMQRWGPTLDRLELAPSPLTANRPEGLGLALFVGDSRRLLLVFNRSRSEYVRRNLTLDDTLGGRPVQRLVEVPGDADVALGKVSEARGSRLVLTLDLAPGDARLYEAF